MRQNGHGERGTFARDSEAGLHDLLEGVDVVLEFAREEFADLLVKTVHVGDQGQQAEEENESYADADHGWCFLAVALARRPFNQAQRQVEFRAQLFFAPSHLSIVALVIVAAQMQDAVQH